MKNCILALAGVWFILPQLAPAQPIATERTWTAVAGTCAPDEESLCLSSSTPELTFREGTTGTIMSRCNVLGILDAANALEVIYRPGNSPGSGVRVELRRESDGGENVVVRGAVFDSNAPSGICLPTAPDQGLVRCTVTFGPEELDVSTNSYYVNLRIERPSPDGSPPSIRTVRLYLRLQ